MIDCVFTNSVVLSTLNIKETSLVWTLEDEPTPKTNSQLDLVAAGAKEAATKIERYWTCKRCLFYL